MNLDEQNKIKDFILDSYVHKNIDLGSQRVHLVHAKAIQAESENDNKTVWELISEGKIYLLNTAVWSRAENIEASKRIEKKEHLL